MLESMTGFGKATHEDEQVWIQVEVKSINAKGADINLQLPRIFSEASQRWKNLATTYLVRGKIDINLQINHKQPATLPVVIQESIFNAYYEKIKQLATAVGASQHNIMEIVLKIPGVVISTSERDRQKPDYDPTVCDTTLQEKVEATLEQALTACKQARLEEGATLASCITAYLQQIQQSLSAIEQLDASRIDTIRKRIVGKLETVLSPSSFDTNRLEQEMVYYLDKLDFTEEKDRLAAHLTYFSSVMATQPVAGKQLGFIAQEISREINTLGVKSNDFSIQKHTIVMKNELEKIKEQLQNIL